MTYGEACRDARRIAKETGTIVHIISARDGQTFEACMEGAPYADAIANGWADAGTISVAEEGTHGWWIDGEFVPCECVRCQMDREEIEEERYLADEPDGNGFEFYSAFLGLSALVED